MISRTFSFTANICLRHSSTKVFLFKQFDNTRSIARNFSLQSQNFQAPNVQSSSDGDILIYEGPLSRKIRMAKVFSLSSSVAGLALQPMLYQKTLEAGTGLGVTIAGATFLGFFTFITPLLLHMVTKKYVSHLFYNPKNEEFTAVTYSIILFPKQTIFKASDVTKPDLPTMFVSFYVKGKPLFADPDYFTDLNVYKKMMGYDKPLDYKLAKPELSKPANFK